MKTRGRNQKEMKVRSDLETQTVDNSSLESRRTQMICADQLQRSTGALKFMNLL